MPIWSESRLDAIVDLLDRHAERLIRTSVQVLQFPWRHVEDDLPIVMEKVRRIAELKAGLQGRQPLCQHPEDELLLALSYNFTAPEILVPILAAVAAGNRVRVKIASRGLPLSDLVQRIFGPLLPEVRFESRPGPVVVAEALANPRVPFIGLWGSEATALAWRDAVAGRPVRFMFEGPGSDPFIVLNSADCDRAAADLVRYKFQFSGQTCTAPERVLVQGDLYERFLKAVVEHVRLLRVGDPMDPNTDIGPVASEAIVRRSQAQLKEALQHGARLLVGGSVHGNLIEPMVLAEVAPHMRVMQEEVFSPLLSIARFDHLEDALAQSRSSPYGLSAAIYGDRASAETLASSLVGQPYLEAVPDFQYGKFGMAGINRLAREHGMGSGLDTFGGYGLSGWVWESDGSRLQLYQGPKNIALETSRP